MSEAEYREKLADYRNRMFRNVKLDAEVCCAASDWMYSEVAQMEQEIKNNRVAARLPLRIRLKNLIALILTQNGAMVKEVVHEQSI